MCDPIKLAPQSAEVKENQPAKGKPDLSDNCKWISVHQRIALGAWRSPSKFKGLEVEEFRGLEGLTNT